ncbi:MAG: ATP-binding cassette domain-containing protein [Tannerellaceae bacterium]|jgi:ATPase subunit of ABC transporter with duplicated ATPase domains|nr:ATP-binding cassette domain-containing protein [Tannerellaceae bacterium]
MITLRNIQHIHPNHDVLFSNVNLSLLSRQKAALTGNNGSGKSTLLRIAAGELSPSAGTVALASSPFYIPQLAGQFNHLSIARALRIDRKLHALHRILEGDATDENFTILNDDWTIEERCMAALSEWGLHPPHPRFPLNLMSGGEKMKVFLAGINIHKPDIILLDEPTNHLDAAARNALYEQIESSSATWLIVSHDRTLLNLLNPICELSGKKLNIYGGNYTFYREQKAGEATAFADDLREKEKELRKARATEREIAERRQRLSSRAGKSRDKLGLPSILLGLRKANAENTTARLKETQADKVETIARELADLRKDAPGPEAMKFGFKPPAVHRGKLLVEAAELSFAYSGNRSLWPRPLNFRIAAGDRIRIAGANGAGKSTLLRLILGELEPTAGAIMRAERIRTLCVDQDYSLLDGALSVYEQAQLCNESPLAEHEVKIRLARFLFGAGDWNKPCSALSGGEKMRLMLCCLTLGAASPDLVVLDEPTNNLDVRNMEILTSAVNEYEGAVVLVSHDKLFTEEVGAIAELSIDLA